MNYRIFHDDSIDKLVSAGFLPEKYKNTGNLFVFGMESDDEKKGMENLLGILVFSADSSRFSVVNLLHISIREKDKEMEYAKELFDYAVSRFRLLLAQSIEFSEAVSKEEKNRYTGILSSLGMKTECSNASAIICKQGSFQGKKLDKVYEMASKLDGKIVMIQNYFDAVLSEFFGKNEKTKFHISSSEYNPKLCRFYLDDGEIKAAVFVRKKENGDILIDGCYTDKEMNQPYIIPYLISVIGFSNKEEIDPARKMFINVYNEKMIDALLQFMNEECRKEVEIKELVQYKYSL